MPAETDAWNANQTAAADARIELLERLNEKEETDLTPPVETGGSGGGTSPTGTPLTSDAFNCFIDEELVRDYVRDLERRGIHFTPQEKRDFIRINSTSN